MRAADLGFAAALGAAAVGVAVGFAVFPTGAEAGLYPLLTAWGPAVVLAAGDAALLGLAGGAVAASAGRRLPTGRRVYLSGGGVAGLGLALMPLVLGTWALAAAVAHLGMWGLRGVLGAAALAIFGIAVGAAGLTLAWLRQEVVVRPGQLARIDGRGWPSVQVWEGEALTLVVEPYRAHQRRTFAVYAVDAGGARVLIGRARTEPEALALRDGVLRDLRG